MLSIRVIDAWYGECVPALVFQHTVLPPTHMMYSLKCWDSGINVLFMSHLIHPDQGLSIETPNRNLSINGVHNNSNKRTETINQIHYNVISYIRSIAR